MLFPSFRVTNPREYTAQTYNFFDLNLTSASNPLATPLSIINSSSLFDVISLLIFVS